jgi:hypothetical protein
MDGLEEFTHWGNFISEVAEIPQITDRSISPDALCIDYWIIGRGGYAIESPPTGIPTAVPANDKRSVMAYAVWPTVQAVLPWLVKEKGEAFLAGLDAGLSIELFEGLSAPGSRKQAAIAGLATAVIGVAAVFAGKFVATVVSLILAAPLVIGISMYLAEVEYLPRVAHARVTAEPPSRIPPEVRQPTAYLKYLRPPDGFNTGVGWVQAIHDDRLPGSSTVEVDYTRFFCRVNGQTRWISGDGYSNKVAGGGLFMRNPWFGTNVSEPLPAEFANGVMTLRTSNRSDRVWHWWVDQYPRPVIPPEADRCWMETRVRITGPALVQAGIDYWRTPTSPYAGVEVNNTEAGASEWHFASPVWQVITVGKPADAAPADLVAMRRLPSGKITVNPDILTGLDLSDPSRPLWLAGDANRWLDPFQSDRTYWGLLPAARQKLTRRADGWFESTVPVASGECFTVAQLKPLQGGGWERVWAQYGGMDDWEGVYGRQMEGAALLATPVGGDPAATWNSWIRLENESGRRVLVIDRHVLLVDDDQLTSGWKLLGDQIGWDYASGKAPLRGDQSALVFDVTDVRGRVNVTALRRNPVDPAKQQVWGDFGHFNGMSVPCTTKSYRHPLVQYDAQSGGAILLP